MGRGRFCRTSRVCCMIFLHNFPLYILSSDYIWSNTLIIHIRSKIVPENPSATLIPDRVYKENRANWNANYQQPDNLHGNTNWSLPTWKESPSRMWNQSNQSNQMKNLRKVSAKQHYLSVARYVAGQSTNLPSRYIMFRNPVQRILIACAMLVIGHFFVRLQIRQNVFFKHLINMFKFIPCGKDYSRTRQPCDTIVCKSIYILTNIIQDLTAVLSNISFPLNIFLNISELVGPICEISRITLYAAHLLYLCRALLAHFVEYLVEGFIIITDSLDQSIQLLALCIIYALRYILAIIVLIIEISEVCLSHSLNGGKYILNGTIFQN